MKNDCQTFVSSIYFSAIFRCIPTFFHLSFYDLFLIMKPWRSEGFSMSPRLLQGYVLKTRLLNENPTELSWEMV